MYNEIISLMDSVRIWKKAKSERFTSNSTNNIKNQDTSESEMDLHAMDLCTDL